MQQQCPLTRRPPEISARQAGQLPLLDIFFQFKLSAGSCQRAKDQKVSSYSEYRIKHIFMNLQDKKSSIGAQNLYGITFSLPASSLPTSNSMTVIPLSL
jgi:hypothetical protein